MREHEVAYRIKAIDAVSKTLLRADQLGQKAESRFNGINSRIKNSNTSLLSFSKNVNKGESSLNQLGKASTNIDMLTGKVKKLENKLVSYQRKTKNGLVTVKGHSNTLFKSGGSNFIENLDSMTDIGRGIAGGQLGPGGLAGLRGLGLAGGAVAGIAAIGYGLNKVDQELSPVLAKFEKYEAVLANNLGSDLLAKKLMSDIVKFASDTPQQIDEITESWVKLAGTGFKPTMHEMMKMADVANAQGKGILQLSEAYLDAAVGEFERLKEFNIQAHKHGDKVSFTFKNQTKTVDYTRNAINNYLLSLGELKGVQGASTAIMKTHGGILSNQEDKVTKLKLAYARGLKPTLTAITEAKSKLIDKLMNSASWIEKNQKAIGSFIGNGLNSFIWYIEKIGKGIDFFWIQPISRFIDIMGKGIKLFNSFNINLSEKIFGKPVGELDKLKKEKLRLEGELQFAKQSGYEKYYIDNKQSELSNVVQRMNEITTPRMKFEDIDASINRPKSNLDKFPIMKYDANAGIYGNIKANKNSSEGNSLTGSKLDDLVKGGKETKNFYVTVESLIKNQNINTTTLQESASKIKDLITEVLITSIRDAEILEGSR